MSYKGVGLGIAAMVREPARRFQETAADPEYNERKQADDDKHPTPPRDRKHEISDRSRNHETDRPEA